MSDTRDDLLLKLLHVAQGEEASRSEEEADEAFDALSARQWLQDQIIDTEALALRFGYNQVATLLFRALDQLAREPVHEFAPKTRAEPSVVLPFRHAETQR